MHGTKMLILERSFKYWTYNFYWNNHTNTGQKYSYFNYHKNTGSKYSYWNDHTDIGSKSLHWKDHSHWTTMRILIPSHKQAVSWS